MKKIICASIALILILSNYSFAQPKDLWNTYTTADGLASNYVNSIIESSVGSLWFGTDEGVSRYHQGTWTAFTITDGLIDNNIRDIAEGPNGALYFATNVGVSRYYQDIWTIFDTADRLLDKPINDLVDIPPFS